VITRESNAAAVLGLGAVVSLVWAISAVRDVLRELDQGGGFATAGSFEVLKYVVPFLLTVWLSMRSRARGSTGRWLRKAYRLTLFAMLVMFGLLLTEPVFHTHIFGHGLIDWSIFVGAFAAGALWLPVHTFFASAFVAVLIRPRASA